MKSISIIMGIYNCEDTLSQAIDSILKQTYQDWELIMCDDGSIDNTYNIANAYRQQFPDKIKLIQNEYNVGLNRTLNNCLSIAEGKYIARMDGDDTCSPDRFEKEIAVLEKEEDIAIVSTSMDCFDENGIWGTVIHKEYPEKKDFIYKSQFCHAPCMVRKEAFDRVAGYSESKWLLRVEDYHLWMKMYSLGYRGKNIQESLYQMRDDRNAYARRKFRYRINEAIVKSMIVKNFNLSKYEYIYALKPIIVGLMPGFVYDRLHKKKLNAR